MRATSLTLRRAWEDHYRAFIAPDDAPQTMRGIESAIRAWERWGPGTVDLRTASAADWSTFKSAMLADGRSPATVNHYLREHRAILRFVHAEGLIPRVPVIRPVREREQVKWRPSIGELGRLYRAVPDAGVTWPLGPPGFASDWWQSLLVWAFVGALRLWEVRSIRDSDCGSDGIALHASKTQRLSFVPGLPCVQRQVERMLRWKQPGTPFLLSAGCGHNQFDRERDRIGEAAGLAWHPHAIKRASIDAWFRVSETAGTIVGHGRRSTACRHYLDRRAYLLSVAHRLEVPAEFNAPSRQLTLF